YGVRRMIFAILDASSRYSSPGSTIGVSAKNGKGTVEIRISDSGEGIEAEEDAHVFQPSWQASPGNRRKGATGFGLYRARQVAESHGGSIVCEKLRDGSCVFTIILPAA